MNTTSIRRAALTIISAGLLLTACNKTKSDTVTTAPGIKTVTNLMADTITNLGTSTTPPFGSGKFNFFSLERNEVVASSDSATNKWDIGVRGTTIIINGGNSGPALGGGFIAVGNFADFTQVPSDSIFRVDNTPAVYALRTGNGLQWYSYNATANIITAVPGRVLFVRTATGKYAKLEILNYYKGGVTPETTASDEEKIKKQRYYTFRFAYQPDGTKKF